MRAIETTGGVARRTIRPMMVALFVYAYTIGVRSSRAIERRCHDDVAFRVGAGLYGRIGFEPLGSTLVELESPSFGSV